MIDLENLIKQFEKTKDEMESFNQNLKITKGVALANVGICALELAFLPLSPLSSIIGVGGILYTTIYLKSKRKKIEQKIVENVYDLEKYKNQMNILQDLTHYVEKHYKKIFQNYNFIKEEEICKKINLNTPEQMDSVLIGKLKEQVKILEELQNGNHYNILLLGRTGVGKRTLINVILDLKGDEAAKENPVKPETGVNESSLINLEENSLIKVEKKKFVPREYSSQKSSLILLDSRGIELSTNYNIDVATEDIKEFIEQRNALNSDPDKFIHCIWYLVSGKRFEDSEGNYVKTLKSLYANFGLPIIFVYTQAINSDDGEAIEERIKDFMGEDINFIQIIAKDIIIKSKNKNKKKPTIEEAFGVFGKDGLIEKSFEFAKNAIKSSFFNYMRNLLKDIFVNNINYKAWLHSNIYIFYKINKVIIEKKRTLEEVRNSFEDDFLETIKLFLVSKNIPEYTKKNKILIKEYFNSFPNLKDPKLIELIEILSEKESDKFVSNYMEINIKAEAEFGIKNTQKKDDIKKMIKKEVYNPLKKQIPYIALSYILFKYMGLLCKQLYNKLTVDFEESYKRIEEITSNELKNTINKVYDNIMENNWFNN